MPGGVRQAAAAATGAPAPVARPPRLDGVNLLASFRGRRNGSDLLSFPDRTCPAWATFRDAGLSAPNASDLPHVAVGEPLATRQELFLSNPPSRISGWKGCYRQLSAKPSNPSGLQ